MDKDFKMMQTISAEVAKEQLGKLIETIISERQHYRITSSEGEVVMLPAETYDNLLVTLELLSTPGLMENVGDVNEHDFVEIISGHFPN